MEFFQVVKQKRRNRRVKEKLLSESQLIVEYIPVNPPILLRKVEKACEDFKVSKYSSTLVSSIREIVENVDCLFCYGLGSLSESLISRHQFAALLTLKKVFNCQTWTYDPVFNPQDIEVIKSFQVAIIDYNDEAKRKVIPRQNTLIYFAHCSSQLVNNFLWANWNHSLDYCVILSNSFSSVIERNSAETVTSLNCMRDVRNICKEFQLSNTYEIFDVFNDLTIHTFDCSKETDKSFWESRAEPGYSGEVIEYCKKEVVVTVKEV